MKIFTGIFLRFTALVLLVTFTFVSCSNPFVPSNTSKSPDEPIVVITPGEGNPRYVYIDSDGNITDADYGRTVLFVEDNKNAEGVLIVSDKADSGDSRVSIYNQNNNSIVSMFFKPDSNFPYYMIINQNEDICYAYLSYYNPSNSTYDIVFTKDGEYSQLSNLVFNKDIFNAYQNDPALSSSQNLRLRNITIALGLWGSLYNAFDDPAIMASLSRSIRGFFKAFVSVVKAVFKAVAVIATVVAVVVAPIVTFINPAAGAVVAKAAQVVAAASTAIVVGLTLVENWLDDDKTNQPGTTGTTGKKNLMINVTNVNKNYEPVENGKKLFHINQGEDVLLEFSSIGWDTTKYNLKTFYVDFVPVADNSRNIYWGYEPGNPDYPYPSSSMSFTITFERENLPPDRFRIRIKRQFSGNGGGDHRVAYGFVFNETDKLLVNGKDKEEEVEYQYSYETIAKTHTNMFVVWFCIDPYCPYH